MSLPKWFRREVFPFYDQQPGIDWSVPGTMESILDSECKEIAKSVSFNGSVNTPADGYRVLEELVALSGMKLISRDLRWDRDPEQKSVETGRVWCASDAGSFSASHSEFESQVMASLMTTDDALIAKFDEYFKANTHKEKVEEYIYAMVSKQGGIKFQRIGKAFEALERGNYNGEVLKLYDRVINELNSPKPRGRIAIFDGPPGTGKTYMVRAILDDVKGVHVMIPSHMVASLADPSILPALIDLKSSQEEPILLIIEDGDEVIAPRGADNMPAISSVLNLGDGILGACLDIRVVITTNAKRQEMDEAMTRPGRLISIVHIGALEVGEAIAVFNRITGTTEGESRINRKMTVAEIYSMALDGGFQPVTAKQRGKVGFGS